MIAAGGTAALAQDSDGDLPPVDEAMVPLEPAGPDQQYIPRPGDGYVEPEPFKEPNYVSPHPNAPELVADCRDVLENGVDDPDQAARVGTCEMVVAKADGKIEPGEYSDAELEQALEEAGVAK